jgi:hypothetical protein
MCPDDPDASSEANLLMLRAKVHTCIDDITRDVQVPWLMLRGSHGVVADRPTVPVDRFLNLMASAFVNEDDIISDNPTTGLLHDEQPAPPHLLGLFYRRHVGTACT